MSQIEETTSESNPLTLESELSAESLYEKCMAVAHNLWWSWHSEVVNLFRDLDPIRWRQLDHNPIALLPNLHLNDWKPEPMNSFSIVASIKPIGD